MREIVIPPGRDPAEYCEETEAKRIGYRIREIRGFQRMTQGELGAKVGLTADRIQKYENGVRKPKIALLKSIAEALGVETLALTDPVTATDLGAMYALFEMEDCFGLVPERIDGRFYLRFGDGTSGEMNRLLGEWVARYEVLKADYQVSQNVEDRVKSRRAYRMWTMTFPKAVTEQNEQRLRDERKSQLEEQIAKLQSELAKIDNK